MPLFYIVHKQPFSFIPFWRKWIKSVGEPVVKRGECRDLIWGYLTYE